MRIQSCHECGSEGQLCDNEFLGETVMCPNEACSMNLLPFSTITDWNLYNVNIRISRRFGIGLLIVGSSAHDVGECRCNSYPIPSFYCLSGSSNGRIAGLSTG